MWEIEISNVAGIRDGSATVEPGINTVQASNWRGKTSLLTALRAVIGANATPSTITEGEQEGRVRLDVVDTGREFSVALARSNGSVSLEGEPYLADEGDRICAELFAFLDAENPLRTAVREGRDLAPHLVRPLERENIEEQIETLRAERRTVESELADLDRAVERLPTVTEQIASTEADLDELREELADEEPNGAAGEQSDLREQLNRSRREREQVQKRVSRLEQKTASLETQIDETESELAQLDVPSAPDLAESLESKRSRLREVDQEIETLEALYNANDRILERGQFELVTEVDRQIDDDHLTCWICGGETVKSDVEARMERLSETVAERRRQRSRLREAVADLEETQRNRREMEQRRESLQRELESLRSDLARSEEDLTSSRRELASLDERIEELEGRVREESDRRSALEREIARKEAELDALRERKADLETKASQHDRLQSQLADLDEEIEALRSRRETVVQRARAAFDEALEDVVERFDPSFESAYLQRHTDPDTGETERLELVIARDGQRISVDALSEGEVELLGFIAALSGYEAFDVGGRVPCMLLDELGGLASENLHTLVTYLEDRTDYLVTTAYPEAGEFHGNVISPTEWNVVSDATNAQG